MAINYNLTIGSLGRKLSVENVNNVVYEVAVSVNAFSEEYPQFTYSCGGNISFDISEIDEDAFVPFEEVTQEVVLGWLLANEGVESVDEFSYVKYSVQNIQDRIDVLQLEDSVNVSWVISNAPQVESTEEVTESPEEEVQEEVIVVQEEVQEEVIAVQEEVQEEILEA